MTALDWPKWGGMFVPDGSLVESFVRGSVVYLATLLLVRVVLRRQGGSIGLPDVMLVVLLSECVSPSLGGDMKSVPNGLAALSALLVWNYALDWLSYRWPRLARWLEPQPVVLVTDGRVDRDRLRREKITDDELAAQLRMAGVDDLSRVRVATLESEGNVSVVTKEETTRQISVEEATARLIEAADVLKRALAWHDEQNR